MILVPEDSGRECNPSDTPSKEPIVSSVHEETKIFGSKMKRGKSLETLRWLHCTFINKFSPQISF